MLLLVFIHGFKGSAETTFADFPSRLAHILTDTYQDIVVQSVVYPTYETSGQLSDAVDNFVSWLTRLVLNYEAQPTTAPPRSSKVQRDHDPHRPRPPLRSPSSASSSRTSSPIPPPSPHFPPGHGGGAGSVKVVLCGHSMGGLIAVDAALQIARDRVGDEMKLWPRVCAVVAYDTPYYGVHPHVFRNTISKYSPYVKAASEIGAVLGPIGLGIASKLGWAAGGANKTPDKGKARAEDVEMGSPADGSSPTERVDKTKAKASAAHWNRRSVSFGGSTVGNGVGGGTGFWSKLGAFGGSESRGDSASSSPRSSPFATPLSPSFPSNVQDLPPPASSPLHSPPVPSSPLLSRFTPTSQGLRNALYATSAFAVAGGAAAAAYSQRENIRMSWTSLNAHMLWLSNLWDDHGLRKRVQDLIELPDVLFHCFYTRLPERQALGEKERTFIILPSRTAIAAAGSFSPCNNHVAKDEVEAHVGMFTPKANTGFYDLGLRSASLIGQALDSETRYGNQTRSQLATHVDPEPETGLREGDPSLTVAWEAELSERQRAKEEAQKREEEEEKRRWGEIEEEKRRRLMDELDEDELESADRA